MGLKTEAKAVAAAAKVACVPGSDGAVATDAEALRLARAIGFPVLIKAAAGGGGKGMRVVPRARSNLAAALADGPQRGRGRVQERQRLHREVHRPPPPRRGPDPGRFARQRRPLLGPRLLAPAPPSEARRGSRLPRPCRWRFAPSSARPPSGWPGRRLRQRRHLRVSRRRRQSVLLHRGQRPDPGRTPRHRDGHRHRPGQAADPHRRRRAPAVRARRDRHDRGHSIECRINSEDPDNDFRPSPGPDHRPPRSRRPGRPLGFARPGRIHRPAQLRLARGQADRPRPDPPRSPRHHAPRPRRTGDRRHHDDDPLHRRIFRNPDFIEGRVDTTWVERVLMPAESQIRSAHSVATTIRHGETCVLALRPLPPVRSG